MRGSQPKRQAARAPASLRDRGVAVVAYFRCLTRGFERGYVAAQAVGSGHMKVRWRGAGDAIAAALAEANLSQRGSGPAGRRRVRAGRGRLVAKGAGYALAAACLSSQPSRRGKCVRNSNRKEL